jgi:hypothetical protein
MKERRKKRERRRRKGKRNKKEKKIRRKWMDEPSCLLTLLPHCVAPTSIQSSKAWLFYLHLQ